MQKLFLLTCLLLLTGCSLFHVHKMDIEQGNVMTPAMMHQLHPGMTEQQVKKIMGTPVLLNTFTPHRVDYIYTYKPGGGTMTEQVVILSFRNSRLQTIKFTPE